eukprot:g2841.t1
MMRQDLETDCRSSLSGAWVLDVASSDTLEDYMRCLAAPEAAIHAQAELEAAYPSRNVISLDESKLVIYKRTASTNSTEDFDIDEEKVVESSTGTVKRSTASLREGGQPDGYILVSETVSTGGHSSLIHVEARQLSPGGHVHTQELSVRNLVTGAQSMTTRFWTRVAVTELDVARLSACRSG